MTNKSSRNLALDEAARWLGSSGRRRTARWGQGARRRVRGLCCIYCIFTIGKLYPGADHKHKASLARWPCTSNKMLFPAYHAQWAAESRLESVAARAQIRVRTFPRQASIYEATSSANWANWSRNALDDLNESV